MKIIDLLNKIANGEEVPTIILFNSYKYRFDKIDRVYRNIRGNSTLGEINELDLYLNDEVEIIEEDKKEDKKIEPLVLQNFTSNQKKIARKVNEIIDYINNGD